jgi:primosomal protein N''
MNAMEELEQQVNDVLDRMKRMAEEGREPALAYNHSKMVELADRLHTRLQQFRKEMTEAGYLAEDDGEPQPERQRVRREYRAKPDDEPSSPAAGDEQPRDK